MSGERRPEELGRLLQSAAGRPVRLTLTANRVSYVSLAALAGWLRRGRGGCPPEVRAFINAHARAQAGAGAGVVRRARRPHSRGRWHDLAAVLAEVNRRHFGGRLSLAVTWGRPVRPGRPVRRRRLGSFDWSRRLVTVNPVLDRPEVPEFFVAYVVFHEMLHALQPAGTRRPHGREFRAAERRYPDYRRAADWQKRNLRALTCAGARG